MSAKKQTTHPAGQKQKQKGAPTAQKPSPLQTKFAQLKQTPITRKVQLKYKSCCGCGCNYFRVEREVGNNSPLNNGDVITSFAPSDVNLGRW